MKGEPQTRRENTAEHRSLQSYPGTCYMAAAVGARSSLAPPVSQNAEEFMSKLGDLITGEHPGADTCQQDKRLGFFCRKRKQYDDDKYCDGDPRN